MGHALTDRMVAALLPPPTGNRITYDATVRGFGCRVTSAGAKAFVLTFRAAGRQRRLTIGSWPDWTTQAARERAKALKRDVDTGTDPMADRHAERAAPTMATLCDRFETEHLPKKRASTARDYVSMIRRYIRPALAKQRVADVKHEDIERLHHSIAKHAPIAANRTVAVLGKMFSLAVRWRMRADSPVAGIERSPEHRRERFLSPTELARLGDVMAKHPERASANAIRLLLLTGARRGEVLGATWDQFDLTAGVWTKPHHATKQGRAHRVPVSAPALALLTEMKAEADRESARRRHGGLAELPYLFPGRSGGASPLTDVKRTWASIRRAARIEGVRLHDLRHSFASVLVSNGMTLPVIGALLGHTQPRTTHRYAHLMDDSLRAATERAGAVISGGGRDG